MVCLQECAMTHRNRIVIIWSAAVILLAIGTILQVKADPTAFGATSTMDISEGDRLAHTLCINCHVVDGRSPVVRTDRVPSFPWIAQQPELTPDYVMAWLATSHERMQDYTLTRSEIRQLTAYIFSLRKQ
jgi:mono/diheme cytochrome c family protein